MSLKVSEVWHTECPVPSATNIAIDQGWLQNAFKSEGIKVSHISSLPFENRLSHFSHRQPQLFRDGGCIPPIWAKSEGVETKVIGMVCSEARQAILVREDSPIESVEELKGKRVALPRDICGLIDYRRASTKRGIIMALEAHGLNQDDVQLVDLPLNLAYTHRPGGASPTRATDPESPPAAVRKTAQQVELEALQRGEVDAIFSYLGREFILEQTGGARVIYNLNEHPDWKLLVHNAYPVTCTVNADFAEDHPDLVKKWMKVLVQAGLWARENYADTLRIIANATHVPEQGIQNTHPSDFHRQLVPEISERGMEALEIEKCFLRKHGFINNDFDVKSWVDGSFLDAALKEVEALEK